MVCVQLYHKLCMVSMLPLLYAILHTCRVQLILTNVHHEQILVVNPKDVLALNLTVRYQALYGWPRKMEWMSLIRKVTSK